LETGGPRQHRKRKKRVETGAQGNTEKGKREWRLGPKATQKKKK